MQKRTRRDEAERIYGAIFRQKMPGELKSRFEAAARRIEAGYTKAEIEEYNRCIHKVSDLEALEFAARLRNRLPLLSDKFRAMVFLAETLPEHYPLFINEKDKRLTAYLWLKVIGIASLWKGIKGMFLLSRCRS
jgi:hypothetical protein